MAVANYTDANGHYPPAHQLGTDGKTWHSWRILILPYIEQDGLSKAYRFDEPWNGPNNSKLADRMPRTMRFTGTDSSTTTTNYLAVVGKETMWPGAVGRNLKDIKDRLSGTILVVENSGMGVHWMEPRDLKFATMDFAIDSPNGVSSWYVRPAIVTADGAVHRLSKTMTPEALRASLTVAGGEEIGDDERGWIVIPDGRDRERKEP